MVVPHAHHAASGCAGDATWSEAHMKLIYEQSAVFRVRALPLTEFCQENLTFWSFFFFFLCWERENREKPRWREKDASCWCLLVHSSSLGSHSVSTGKAYTTIPQSTSCGYGFCDELTLSDFLYFSHKHDQILLCLATQNRDPHPMPVYRQQIIT